MDVLKNIEEIMKKSKNKLNRTIKYLLCSDAIQKSDDPFKKGEIVECRGEKYKITNILKRPGKGYFLVVEKCKSVLVGRKSPYSDLNQSTPRANQRRKK